METTAKMPVASLEEQLRALEEMQRATLNILEDFNAERQRLEEIQRATGNILEDFDSEKTRLEGVQRATLNILEDFHSEKAHLMENQRAFLNILDDIDVEKERVAAGSQQLEAMNKELEAFSYSVSHDLRAPLRAIDGFSRILLEDYGSRLGEDGNKQLLRVCGASQRMGQLIDDLLNLSHITRNQMVRETVDLSDLAHRVAKELQSGEPGRDVQLIIEPGLRVEADPHLMRVVLANLVGNAWKFTRKRPDPMIEVGAVQQNGQPAFFVRDNGAGFDMAYAGKLFGAFQRLHRATEFEGTGIGLATVQRIVRRHGGRVWAESAVEQGATFYFTL